MTTAPNRKPKILYVASTASHLRRFHMPYIKALRETADVYLLASGDDDFLDYRVPFEKSMFSTANLRTVFQIRKILKKERFDAVILHTTLAAFLTRAAMFCMPHRPYVHNFVHGYLFHEPLRSKKDRLLRFCERFLRRKTDTITVMNEMDLEIAKKNKLCRGDISFVFGMGVDMPAELPQPQAELRAQYAKKDELLCTFVGELSHRKNQGFLIEAIGRLRQKNLPVKLMLVGEGADRAELEEKIRSLSLEKDVFLLGNREPVLPYLAISDLYVSASHIEGLPFNIMEAMACGLPILASDTKGQTDLLATTADALYPAGDVEAFCAMLTMLYETGVPLGVGAREYPALARYRLPAVFKENMEILKKGWC